MSTEIDEMFAEEEAEVTTDENQESTEEESTGEIKSSSPEPENEKTEEVEPEDKQEAGLKATMHAERERRQKAETKAQELEAKLAELNKPKEESPDFYDDPDAYKRNIDETLEQTKLEMKINLSKQMMMREHDDYEEKEAVFIELVKEDPSLGERVRNSDFPAEFVYNHVMKHERLSQFDSFDDAVGAGVKKATADMEAKIRAEVEAEYKAKLDKSNSIPPSGAAHSKGGSSESIEDYTTDDLLA